MVDIDSDFIFVQYAAVDGCILNSRTFQPEDLCQLQSMELRMTFYIMVNNTLQLVHIFFHICTSSVFASPCL